MPESSPSEPFLPQQPSPCSVVEQDSQSSATQTMTAVMKTEEETDGGSPTASFANGHSQTEGIHGRATSKLTQNQLNMDNGVEDEVKYLSGKNESKSDLNRSSPKSGYLD